MSEEFRPPMETHFETSPSTDAIFGALAKAQLSYGPVLKKQSNPFFKSKYADLDAVIDAVKKPLSENGLCFTQLPGVANAVVVVTTILGHSSGQWIRATLKMPTSKPDAQGVGSAITYARRYALQAIVGVSAEEDDDGNAAVSDRMESRPAAKKPKPEETRRYEPELCTGEQLSRLFVIARKNGWSDKEVKDMYGRWGYEHSKEIQSKDYEGIIEELESRLLNQLKGSVEQVKQRKLEVSAKDIQDVVQESR